MVRDRQWSLHLPADNDRRPRLQEVMSLLRQGQFSGPGGVSVVDAATGHLLRTVALGTQPTSIALDERTGRAFIGDAGDGALRTLPDPWSWMPARVRQRLAFLPQRAPLSRPIPGSVIVLDTSRL